MLAIMFVAEARKWAEAGELDIAQFCLVNALSTRDLLSERRETILSILADIQAEQRRQWRGQ